MGRFTKSEKSWDEFQWEREIRRDEQRISCYFRELACCMDLPGEESIIFDNLAAQPGLVPTNADPGHWRFWDDLDQEAEEERDDGPETARRRKPGDELVEQIDKLACEWNVLFALDLRESMREEGLAVGCGFGKLLARMADFVETDETELPGLKISLGKRALSDLNDVVGMLLAIGGMQRSLQPKLILLVEFLQQLRERIVDTLSRLRRTRQG